ncbi:hypothetical protein C4573_01850 [Candidatus Woesearchaeota archaeon]|nr:MAG: hypothetical protein C4573_01850 [Candidatus Woesearchaeota archaeon]
MKRNHKMKKYARITASLVAVSLASCFYRPSPEELRLQAYLKTPIVENSHQSMAVISECDIAEMPSQNEKMYFTHGPFEEQIDEQAPFLKARRLRDLDYCAAIDNVHTPAEATAYIQQNMTHGGDMADGECYGNVDYWASFKIMHESRFKDAEGRIIDDCDGGALAAAALLQDNGYPPVFIMMNNEENESHVVFAYRTPEGYGSLGMRNSDINPPCSKSITDLVRTIGTRSKHYFTSYRLYDMSKIFPDFAENDKNNDLLPFPIMNPAAPFGGY